MPAQYPGVPRGRFALRNGVGRRMVDRLGWNSNPIKSPRGEGTFISPKFYGKFTLSGITRDSVGSPLGLCDVRLFKADNFDQEVGFTTSDAGGNFTFNLGTNEGYYWIEAYKAGSPDLASTSVRTLVAT